MKKLSESIKVSQIALTLPFSGVCLGIGWFNKYSILAVFQSERTQLTTLGIFLVHLHPSLGSGKKVFGTVLVEIYGFSVLENGCLIFLVHKQ